METTYIKSAAECYYISDPKHSFAMFMIGEKGDLMINSDWGFYAYAWRSFGDDFKDFLCSINGDYFIGCLESNCRMHFGNKKIPKAKAENIIALFKLLQNQLKHEKHHS